MEWVENPLQKVVENTYKQHTIYAAPKTEVPECGFVLFIPISANIYMGTFLCTKNNAPVKPAYKLQ